MKTNRKTGKALRLLMNPTEVENRARKSRSTFENTNKQGGRRPPGGDVADFCRFCQLFACVLGTLLLILTTADAVTRGRPTIKERVPTFLEHRTTGKTEQLPVAWEWTAIEGRRHAYQICVTTPATWQEAFLLIDGHRAKTISVNKGCFNWTFEALSVGKHKVTLLVIDKRGRMGTVRREVRIR